MKPIQLNAEQFLGDATDPEGPFCILRQPTHHPNVPAFPLDWAPNYKPKGLLKTDLPLPTQHNINILLFETAEDAQLTLDAFGEVPGCEHSIVSIHTVKFDVWLHGPDGQHIQGEGLPFLKARALYLTCLGFAALHERYWEAKWGPAGTAAFWTPEHQKPTPPTDPTDDEYNMKKNNAPEEEWLVLKDPFADKEFEIHFLEPPPPGSFAGSMCPDCKGTGDAYGIQHERTWDKCETCNGEGYFY